MPNNELIDVNIVLDRSGSMAAIKSAMEEGFMTFMREQTAVPGRITVSLYRFDSVFEVGFEEQDPSGIKELGLVPRGGTALFDALGKSMIRIEERIAKKPENERPGGVVVLIVTDGEENASVEFKLPQIKQMIDQHAAQRWQFAYLGSALSTFGEAQKLGMQSRSYDASEHGTKGLMASTSRGVSDYRHAVRTSGSLNAKLSIDDKD